jgi:hypothetical protein
MQSLIEWAQENGHRLRWTTVLDNHEPPRDTAHGNLYTYNRTDRAGEGIVIEDASDMREPHKCSFIIDDGRTVKVFYVASWNPDTHDLILHRLPVNFEEDGSPILRADDQRPVDYSDWVLGPRRCYHLKVREP